MVHPQTHTTYFCAVDICQILCNTPYKTAQSYWKTIKQRNKNFSLAHGYTNTQTKFKAKDGKFYFMDVITIEQVLYLIRHIKHKNNVAHRQLLALVGVQKFIKKLQRLATKAHKTHIQYLCKHQKPFLFATETVSRVFNVGQKERGGRLLRVA